jgi:hypothetical protein
MFRINIQCLYEGISSDEVGIVQTENGYSFLKRTLTVLPRIVADFLFSEFLRWEWRPVQ